MYKLVPGVRPVSLFSMMYSSVIACKVVGSPAHGSGGVFSGASSCSAGTTACSEVMFPQNLQGGLKQPQHEEHFPRQVKDNKIAMGSILLQHVSGMPNLTNALLLGQRCLKILSAIVAHPQPRLI